MNEFDRITHRLARDASFRAAFTADPESAIAAHGLTLTEAERGLLESMRALLALPTETLLHGLLDGVPDLPPLWYGALPFPERSMT